MKTPRFLLLFCFCLAAPLVATAEDPQPARTKTASAPEASEPRALPPPATGAALFEGYSIEMRITEMPNESLRVGATLEGSTTDSIVPGSRVPMPEGSPQAEGLGAPNIPGVKVLAAPRVWVMPRENMTVEIAGSQIFTYLESQGEGRYIARHSEPQKLGMKLSVKADPSPDDESVVLCRLACETSALVGREPVKGLDLEVGRPIVSSWSMKTTVATRLQVPSVVFLPSGPNRTCLLTIVVNKHLPKPEEGRQILPNPSSKP